MVKSNTQRVGGTQFIAYNGTTLPVRGEVEVGYGGAAKSPVVGLSGPQGFTEEHEAPFIKAKITDRNSLDLKVLFEGEGATITHQLPGGKTRVLRDAYYTGERKVDTVDGSFNAQWHGSTLEEF